VFTYENFNSDVNNKEALIKAHNRMASSGRISKLAKGKYFKPYKTPFGNLLPSQEQKVKDLLEDNGKIGGYLTGYRLYNKLGLITQISNTIQIGENQTRPKFKRDRYTISFVKQRNTLNKKNIPLLQILDATKSIKRIPDIVVKTSCVRLLAILQEMTLSDRKDMRRFESHPLTHCKSKRFSLL